MELQNGRPETTSGRLDKEIRVYDLLDKLGIAYQRVDHEATMTMEACEEVDRILGDDTTICKNLFLCNRQETNFYLLLMPGDKPFKTKDLSAQINSCLLYTSSDRPFYIAHTGYILHCSGYPQGLLPSGMLLHIFHSEHTFPYLLYSGKQKHY